MPSLAAQCSALHRAPPSSRDITSYANNVASYLHYSTVPKLAATCAAKWQCRCRRPCRARVMAFQWANYSDTDTAAKTKANKDINKQLQENAYSPDLHLDITLPAEPPSTTPSCAKESGSGSYIANDSSSGIASIDKLGYDDTSRGRSSKNPMEAAIAEIYRMEPLRDVQRSVLEAVHRAKGWWQGVPDKRAMLMGSIGLFAAAYLGNAVLSAVDRVPLLPGLLEAVGFAFTCWFWWRFVLFADGRTELREALADMQRSFAERLDGLEEETLGTHLKAGSGEAGVANAGRRVVGRMAARRSETQEEWQKQKRRHQQQQQQQLVQEYEKDDSGWVVGSEAGSAALDEGYVRGLLEDSSELSGRDVSAAGGVTGRSSPSVFAFLVLSPDGSAKLLAPELSAEEAGGGGGPSTQRSAAGSGGSGGNNPGSGAPPGMGEEVAGHEMADLDPCLGWDTEACAASGHLKLGQADRVKLESLEEEARRQAREAVGFSRHVDEVLHEPTSRGSASLESVQLEGEYGRAAGTMEREVMEDLAAHNPDIMAASVRHIRKPAVGEEAGTGP